MTRWLPPVYREPLMPRRPRALDPGRPALRMVTIALLTVLFTLLAFGAMWAILLP
jgi:hypothetical protein